jgi:ATP-dependent exoDNAse (exonuclease V) beta subunit
MGKKVQLAFDARQTEAIRAEGNAVVMAGAGSGKTAVIAERYCRLLGKAGMGVDRILALTFTQKAAAEMYERIYERLRSGPDRLRRHLESFERAQISTLDSFCAEILKQACERFGLPDDFRYDEQAVTRLAERLGLEFLLENLQLPAVQTLLHIHGFESLWQELFKDLACRHLHLPGHFDFPSMARNQIDRCRLDLAEQLLAVRSPVEQLLKIDPRTASIRNAQQALSAFAGIAGNLESGRYTEAAEKLELLKFKKPGGRGGEDIQLLKSLIDQLRSHLGMLTVLAATLAREHSLLEVFSLLENFASRFIEGKRTLGLIGFQDAAELAVEALVRDKALRQFYKNKFRYIMIDEFQDNNRLQKDLLFLLAERLDALNDGVPSASSLEPDKLLFVGDEKQSIYRFRGAEVAVFKSLHEQLREAGGRTIALDRNYRSVSELIGFVNRVFESVMADPRAEYEARYQRMTKGGPEAGVPAQIHLFYGNQEQPQEPETAPPGLAEAYAVARFIRRSVEEKTLPIASPQGIRPAGYDDFAVLLRSTGNQIHYERMLRHFEVPYATDNLRSLFAEAPVNDFYLLLQLAVYPEDRPAYAGILRSPFVKISDEASIRLLLDGSSRKAEPFSDFEDLEMSVEDRRRMQQGREIYLWVREAADRVPIAEIFHSLWYRYGYRYTILRSPRNHNYLEYYDYMVKLAERADSQGESLAVFLDFLRQNLGRYERIDDITVLGPRRPGVQLLTIHRSKGLEFPIVVLADTGNLGRSARQASKPYYVSSRYGITVNLGSQNYFTEIGEKESENEELAEIKRLLYVAVTRARSHLILAGTHKLKNRSSPRAHLNLLLQALGLSDRSLREGREGASRAAIDPSLEIHRIPVLKWEQLNEISRHGIGTAEAGAMYSRPPIRRTAAKREISVTDLCALLEPLVEPGRGKTRGKSPARNLPAIEADALLNELDLETRFGILTHQLLAQWGSDPAGSPPEPDWTRIPGEHRERLLASALALCRNFFDSELGTLSVQATRVQREWPFLYLYQDEQGPLYINGQMDLAFELQDRLYLVDFKTDRRYRTGEHECQLALYRLAAAEQSEREIHTFLFLLRSAQALRCDKNLDLAEWIPRVRHLL